MVQSITLPFGILNNIPGVSGVSDVSFDIPEVGDIEEIINEAVIDQTQLDEILRSVIQDELPDPSDLVLDIDQLVDEIIDEIESGLTLPDIDPDRIVEDILSGVQEDLPQLELNVNALADSIADRIDVTGEGGRTVNIEGVFGPLREDVVEGLEAVLSDLAGTAEDLPEDINSLAEALSDIREAIDQLVPEGDQDLLTGLSEGIEDTIEEILPDWITQPLDETIVDFADGLEDRLFDDEVQEALSEEAERLGP